MSAVVLSNHQHVLAILMGIGLGVCWIGIEMTCKAWHGRIRRGKS